MDCSRPFRACIAHHQTINIPLLLFEPNFVVKFLLLACLFTHLAILGIAFGSPLPGNSQNELMSKDFARGIFSALLLKM